MGNYVANKLSLNETDLVYFFSADIGCVFNVRKIGEHFFNSDLIEAYLDSVSGKLFEKKRTRTILNLFKEQDKRYFAKHYIDSGRFVRLEAHMLRLILEQKGKNQTVNMRVLFCLHSIGVASILLWLEGVRGISKQEILKLEVPESQYIIYKPDSASADFFVPHNKEKLSEIKMSLQEIASSYADWLASEARKWRLNKGVSRSAKAHDKELTANMVNDLSTRLKAARWILRLQQRLENTCPSGVKLIRSLFIKIGLGSYSGSPNQRENFGTIPLEDPYVGIFATDLGKDVKSITDFVLQNKLDLFDILCSRSYYIELEYHKTRKDGYIRDSIKDLSKRAHVSRFLSEQRYVVLSTIKYHPELYPYGTQKWFANNIVMIENAMVVRTHFLSLWHKIQDSPCRTIEELVALRQNLVDGLQEYFSMGEPKFQLTQIFGEDLKNVLGINKLVEQVKDQMARIGDSIDVVHGRQFERKQGATQRAIEILYLIAALPVATQLIDILKLDPKPFTYFFVWAGIIVIFYSALWISKKFYGT